MWNLLISLAIGAAVAVGIGLGTSFGWVPALVPAVIALVVAYFVLARRSMKQLTALMEGVQREIQKEAPTRRFEKSIEKLKGGFALAPWQFMVGSQIHGHIGVLYYLQKQFEAAVPHLEKSFARHWVARGMLASLRYQRKDVAGAKAAFEAAVRDNKKESVLWAAYAWVLEKEGAHEEAITVLGRGVKANPTDEKLKVCQQALQNGKKLKLGKVYDEQWFQFLLEVPPNPSMSPMFRGNRRALYRGG